MKLQILQENLAKAVGTAARFSSARAQLPILGNILLTAKKTKIIVSATNLEISVSIEEGAKIEEEGEIALPSKVISEMVANLPKETISLESEKEQLKISATGFSSSVLGMNSSDFPKIPSSLDKEKSIVLPRKEFLDSLSQVIFAASLDETRPVLTGVLLVLEKDALTMVATDGFRLSQKKIKVSGLKPGIKVVLPKLVLSELGRTGEGSEEVLFSLEDKEKQVVFGLDGVILTSRLLEGTYPDYEKIIPKKSSLQVSLDKEDFLRAVKLASIFARDAANIVKIRVLKESIKVFAESASAGSQETKLEARVEGAVDKEFEIAFNYRFLEDFLHSVQGEEVRMEFSEVSAPGVFIDSSDSSYFHLIMPVKIQS